MYFMSCCTEFLHADSLTVSNVTNVSANFVWTHAAKNNIHHIEFKVYSYTYIPD